MSDALADKEIPSLSDQQKIIWKSYHGELETSNVICDSNIINCTEWASKFLYNKGLFLRVWGLTLQFHLYSTFITATLWHSSFQEDIQCHTLCLYTLKYVVSRMENGFSGTAFLGIALGFMYYPGTIKHTSIYRIHRLFLVLSSHTWI